MLEVNLEEPRILEKAPLLTGVVLDPITGPITTTRPIAVLKQSSVNKVREINESATEDIYSRSELDARYAQLGWPSPGQLPIKPWITNCLNLERQSTLGGDNWATRRFMVQRATINLSPQDLSPVEPFVDAVEAALSQETQVGQIEALQSVFTTWGEMIPLNMVAGAYLAVTGMHYSGNSLLEAAPSLDVTSGRPPYDLADIIDQHLGTSRKFERRLESRVQGGSSDALLNEGYGAWLRSVAGNPASWTIIKVHHAVPITTILSDTLQERITQLFAGSLMYRSPTVGAPHGFSFEGAAHGLRDIGAITIWFSDLRVRDISVKYSGDVVSGPYAFGVKNPYSPADIITLAPGEYITDVFVWHHTDGWIAGLQFVKSTLECTPIYGIRYEESINTHPPVLLSGNGNALIGISGSYNAENICQVKAVWRSDVTIRRHRHTQTSFVGGQNGRVFNDLQYLADPSTSRIVQISARVDGSLANFQTTYLSATPRGLVRSETPDRGWDRGPMRTITLEADEYIIGARGSHNHGWIQQIQFITNKREHPTFGNEEGNSLFSFDAPKTIDGRDMVLHYMAGKSEGCVHSFLFVWAEMPLKGTCAGFLHG